MKYLIVSTLPEEHPGAAAAIAEAKARLDVTDVVYTSGMKIAGCVGCNDCWLRTPGICRLKDDYEQLLIRFLQVDCALFITDTKLGFISYQAKNLFDRILPLATMHLKFVDGQMRHYSRYGKELDVALLYEGEADNAFMNRWLHRAIINMHGKSFGAYPLESRKELYDALDRN